jgi:hypothetical protein
MLNPVCLPPRFLDDMLKFVMALLLWHIMKYNNNNKNKPCVLVSC